MALTRLKNRGITDSTIADSKLSSTLDLSGKTITYGLSDGDMPSGSILQVVGTTITSYVSTSSTSAWTTAASINITPSSTSSKIAFFSNFVVNIWGTAGRLRGGIRLSRGSTIINGGGTETVQVRELAGSSFEYLPNSSLNYIDTPGTSSQVTYNLEIIMGTGGASAFGLYSSDANGRPSYLMAMEIAG